MPVELEIRRFRTEDERDLVAAWAAVVQEGRAFAGRASADLASFREAWLSGTVTVQVARQNGTLVGGYFLKPAFPGSVGRVANAGYLVPKEHRGSGVGRALAEHSFVLAGEHGFDAMLLSLLPQSNQPSSALWEHLGFTTLGVIPGAVDGEDAPILWRPLTSVAATPRDVQRPSDFAIRDATAEDATAIAAIYAEAVRARAGTFDTTSPPAERFAEAIGIGPAVVAEVQGVVVGWARVGPYMPTREGIGLYQLYVTEATRGHGVGGQLLAALLDRAQLAGYFKVIGRILASNQPALRAARSQGFRTVGVLRRHGKIDGTWHDVIEVERLLGDAAAP